MKWLMVWFGIVFVSLFVWVGGGVLQLLCVVDVVCLYVVVCEWLLVVEIWLFDCGYCCENVVYLVVWQCCYLDVQFVMVVMDVYDDNGVVIVQVLVQMNLLLQVVQYVNVELMFEWL